MRKILNVAMMASALLSSGAMIGSANAAEKGTIEEATAMVKKAADFMKDNGNEKAFAEISNPKGQFVDRDLYVFVTDTAGKSVAHGGNPQMVGKDLSDLKDADGKPITKGLLAAASKGNGTYSYKYMNPVSKTVEPKTAYVQKVGEFVVGAGAYTK